MKEISKQTIEGVVKFCAKNLRVFTSDHVNLLCQYGGIQIGKRDVSAAILRAKGQKLIKRTDKARISDQDKSNSIPRVVWKSLLRRVKAAKNV